MFIPLYFSFARWQMISMEKLNASPKARHSHQSCFPNETIIIVKQNRQAVTVSAFFSERYFLSGDAKAMIFLIVSKDNDLFYS